MITRRAALTGLIATIAAQDLKAQTKNTLFLSAKTSFLHDPGPGWPDRPNRITSILDVLKTPEFAGNELHSNSAHLQWTEQQLQLHPICKREHF